MRGGLTGGPKNPYGFGFMTTAIVDDSRHHYRKWQ